MRAVALLLGLLAAAAGQAQQGDQPHHRRFEDAQRWSRVFDDPERDAWQKPHEVIRALKLAPDAVIADIGSGTGYFAVRLARMVPKGRVYGADISPDMVKFLNDRAAKERLPNLGSHLAGEADPRLPAKVDLALIVDAYHHIASRVAYFDRLRKDLRPGGRVAVIDFRMDSPTGPPPAARMAPERVSAEMERAGYRLAERHEFLPNQYFLVFAPR